MIYIYIHVHINFVCLTLPVCGSVLLGASTTRFQNNVNVVNSIIYSVHEIPDKEVDLSYKDFLLI